MKLLKELKYSLYIMIHPFDGFYDLKFEKRGSMKSAGILYLLFVLSVIIKRQLTGYLFNPNDTEDHEFLPGMFFGNPAVCSVVCQQLVYNHPDGRRRQIQ